MLEEAQNTFLKKIVDQEIPVTVFLICSIKLQGVITAFDHESLLLRRDGHTQMIYKHAISTIMPSEVIQLDR